MTFWVITLHEGCGYDKHLPFMQLLYLWTASILAIPFYIKLDGERGTEERAF